MTQRETVMAKVVAVGVVSYIAFLGVGKLIVDPYRIMAAELTAQTAKRNKLNAELLVAYGVKKTWKAHTRRTLSKKDEHEVERRWPRELSQAIEAGDGGRDGHTEE